MIHLQDARLKCPPSRSNHISVTSQTLITPNVSGKAAFMTQRAVEKVGSLYCGVFSRIPCHPRRNADVSYSAQGPRERFPAAEDL